MDFNLIKREWAFKGGKAIKLRTLHSHASLAEYNSLIGYNGALNE